MMHDRSSAVEPGPDPAAVEWANDKGSSALLLLDLDQNLLLQVLVCLPIHEVCKVACICRSLRDLALEPELWKAMWRRECPPALQPHLQATQQAASTKQHADWKALTLRAVELRDLECVKWQRVKPGKMCPTPREGHAAQSWGNDGMLLFGGWGGGIRNDLWLLRPGSDGALSWNRFPAVGRPPAIRYGHSVTRCGRNWDMLFVYGGMQRGGYSGEIEAPAVLRPIPPEDLDSTKGQATTTSSCGTPWSLHPSSGPNGTPHGQPSASAAPSTVPCGLPSSSTAPVATHEWHHPKLTGNDPEPRGYHAACASEDGTKVFLFGGIAGRDSNSTLAIVDVETWEATIPTTHGSPPSPRFGCSLTVYKNTLWVVGGGYGWDLARSGHDLQDVHCLDLATWQWSKPPNLNTQSWPARFQAISLGRCHASCRVGSKLLLFGGSLELNNLVAWIDLEAGCFGAPQLLPGVTDPPGERMSAVMALVGDKVLVYGGWIYSEGEMGDLHQLQLGFEPAGPTASPSRGATAFARAKEAAAVAAAAEAQRATQHLGGWRRRCGGASTSRDAGARDEEEEEELAGLMEGGRGWGGMGQPVSFYYQLLREAGRHAGAVPPYLLQSMHQAMAQISLMRPLAQQPQGQSDEDEVGEEETDEDEAGEEETDEQEEEDGQEATDEEEEETDEGEAEGEGAEGEEQQPGQR